MAEIRAFRGLRFDTEKAGDIGQLACPPYDIISEVQREAFLSINPHNIIRLELPAGENRYEEAGQTLRAWLSSGILRQDDEDALYVYEMGFESEGQPYAVKGFITLVKLEDFTAGVILPHEETLSKAKADRFHLMSATHCNFSQIYSLYKDEEHAVFPVVDAASQGAPDVSFTDADGVAHRLWRVTDADVITTVVHGCEAKKLYIADGHHRYETALNYRNHLREQGTPQPGADYVCMMLVNMENDGLVVLPTHRIVRGLADFDAQSALTAAAEYFEIVSGTPEVLAPKLVAAYTEKTKSTILYTGSNRAHLLTLRDISTMEKLLPEKSEAYRGLDVSVLHTLVLERIFGIDRENMANQRNLTYTRDAAEALAAVDAGQADCAFLLNATRVEEIRDVAAAGEKMPQKSTYFYPKLTTGLVMNRLY